MRWSLFLLFGFGIFSLVKADVTVVQSIQAVDPKGVLQPAQEMTLYLTGDKLRLDSGDISSIIRADKKMTYSILHADKVFVIMPHLAGGPVVQPMPEAEPVKAKRTGKNDRINGFDCVEVEIEQSDGTTLDAWMTQDPQAAKAQDSLKAWQSGEYAPLLAGVGLRQGTPPLAGMEGMAVRTTVLDEHRQPTVRVEIKQLSSATIRAELFEPPPGYKETSMEAIDSLPLPENASDLGKSPAEKKAASEQPKK